MDLDQAIAAVRGYADSFRYMSGPSGQRQLRLWNWIGTVLESLRPGKSDQERAHEIIAKAENEGAINTPAGTTVLHWRVQHKLQQYVSAALTAARVAGALEMKERAAQVIEQNQEAHRSDANGDSYYVSPRKYNNLSGLAYAEAIRSLTPEPQP